MTVTSLRMADLTGADLRDASIFKSDLESAIFQGAVLGITRLINCDLSRVIGLEMTRHTGPSAIGLDTLAKSGGRIPERFLENAGVSPQVIASQASLRGSSQDYPSVLIVSSGGDSELAGLIRSGLLSSQIPCWAIAADDEAAQNSGETILAHSIYYDQLLLLCTAQSLDSSQTSQYFAELAGSQPASEPTISVLAADDLLYERDDRLCTTLKEGGALDFRGWEDADTYGTALASLVRMLSRRSF